MSDSLLRGNLIAFAPKTAYEYAVAFEQNWPGQKLFQADNPPYGAELVFRVGPNVLPATTTAQPNGDGAARRAPRDTATIVVTDFKGDTVRTLRAPVTAGMNRVVWDLRAKAAPPSPTELRDSVRAAQRTKAREDSIKAAKGADTTAAAGAAREQFGAPRPGGVTPPNLRPAEVPLGGTETSIFARGPRTGPQVPEGSYNVFITVNGQTVRQALRVERVTPINDAPLFGEDHEP
jgi:hypothetical protein